MWRRSKTPSWGTPAPASSSFLAPWWRCSYNDSYEAAIEAKNLIPDERATHYFDGSQAVGDALAPVLGTKMDMAWDVYLVYDANAEWDAQPSPPVGWLHQRLDEDPERFFYRIELEEMIRKVLE